MKCHRFVDNGGILEQFIIIELENGRINDSFLYAVLLFSIDFAKTIPSFTHLFSFTWHATSIALLFTKREANNHFRFTETAI